MDLVISRWLKIHLQSVLKALCCGAVILLLVGCGKSEDCEDPTANDRILDQIESEMLQYPEKLDSMISSVDTVNMTRCDSGRFRMIKGYYYYKNENYGRSINELAKADSIFLALNDPYYANFNNLIKAFVFEKLDLDANAAELYLSCNAYFKDNQIRNLKFYSNLGLLRSSALVNLSKETLIGEIKDDLKKLNQPLFEGLFYAALANSEKNDSLQIIYFEMAKEKFTLIGSWSRAYTAEVNALFPRMRRNQLDTVQQLYNQIKENYGLHQTNEIDNIRFRYSQASLKSRLGQSKEAKAIIENLLEDVKSIDNSEMELNCLKFLSILNYRLDQYKEAYYFQYNATELEKERNAEFKKNQVLAMGSHYRFSELEREKENLRAKFTNSIVISGASIFILLALIFITWSALKQSRLKQENLMLKNMEVEEQITRLVNSLEAQKSKNNDLIKKVEGIGQQYKDSLATVRLISDVEQGLIDNWLDFEAKFLSAKHVWINNLKTKKADLTATEVKYCMCFYLDLSNSAIARLCCVSFDAVKSAKKRIRTKFSLSDASELTTYLHLFD